ncbi:hypothetical protein SJI19_16095 [Acerihabitans sp. TG2]|nr:hypothetical protein [Acerihabitans sp. TG2]MEA9392047.1 hypothetical protein [Acerihabitans sp. TG2]
MEPKRALSSETIINILIKKLKFFFKTARMRHFTPASLVNRGSTPNASA